MFKNIMSAIDLKLNDLVTGEDIVPIHQSDNLLLASAYENAGFFIKNVLDETTFEILKNRITSFIQNRVEKTVGYAIPEFSLEQYHTYILNDADHAKVATWEMDAEILGGIEEIIKSRIAESINVPLKIKKIISGGILKEIIGFRIVRPFTNDESPFHRDSWIRQWENTLNVWIPIAGCKKENSLMVVENSHFWNDSKICRTRNGVVYNNRKYRVSAAISTDYNVNYLTPNPQYGEALVFSPYLIHGNARNHMQDLTRVSIELRYERADDTSSRSES